MKGSDQVGLTNCWSHIPHCWKSHVTAHICIAYMCSLDLTFTYVNTLCIGGLKTLARLRIYRDSSESSLLAVAISSPFNHKKTVKLRSVCTSSAVIFFIVSLPLTYTRPKKKRRYVMKFLNCTSYVFIQKACSD